jgi:hypothetical protein
MRTAFVIVDGATPGSSAIRKLPVDAQKIRRTLHAAASFLSSQCGLSRTAAGREVALRRGTYLRTAESVSSCPIVEFARIATVMPT